MLSEITTRRTGIAVAIGLAIAIGLAAGATALVAPDDPTSDATANETESSEATEPTETEFPWGTVVHETDPETGAVDVNVTVEADDGVSISATTADDPTTEPTAEPADGVETETFPWGTVTYATDPGTGPTDVDVLVDAADDVSLTVTALSDGEVGDSTTVTAFSDVSSGDGDATPSPSTSVSASSQSTITSSSSETSSPTSMSVSQSTSDDGSIEVEIEIGGNTEDG